MHFIPTRVWLVLLIAMFAYRPFAYVLWRTAGVSLPGAPDEPARDSKAEQRRLIFNLVMLVALVAFTLFVFSQAAVRFVHLPTFLPLLMAACAAMGLYMTAQGAITGRIEPLSRGSFGPYDRVTQPKRYWLSMIWNGLWTVGCAFLMFKI